MISKEELEQRIKSHLPSATMTCYDMTGGGDHWQVKIRAKEFAGKSLIEQHQMVYKALNELMNSQIHALSLDTGSE